jgi:general secretion pathway protein F
MSRFRYRALTQSGELVTGELAAPHRVEVLKRIEYLGLIPVETENADEGWSIARLLSRELTFATLLRRGPSPDDVTTFSRDFAILLRSNIRLDQALELLADPEMSGALAPVVASLHTAIRSGESLADALGQWPDLFPADYAALVRIGEVSGNLAAIIDALAEQRSRMASLRQSAGDALRYPAFLLCATFAVLMFFLLFVLPKFASAFQDLGSQIDPIVRGLLWLSEVVREHMAGLGLGIGLVACTIGFILRSRQTRQAVLSHLLRLPGLRSLAAQYRTAIVCRMLGTLLANGTQLTTALQLIAGVVADERSAVAWQAIKERVRQGGRLADALAGQDAVVPVALRMLKIGEEAGHLPAVALRAAELVEARLERQIKRASAAIGPAAILAIATIVGGLVVSLMTSLISIGQLAN